MEDGLAIVALMKKIVSLVICLAVVGAALHGQAPQTSFRWIDAGSSLVLPRQLSFENASGQLGVLNGDGPVATKGHPFFESLGSNGRACVTCHQPAGGMSLSVDLIQERWRATKGTDALFAAIDGSDNPSAPQDRESSHSLLLKRGLFRVGLPWPPAKNATPEFTIENSVSPLLEAMTSF